jgi:hypothetical protein
VCADGHETSLNGWDGAAVVLATGAALDAVGTSHAAVATSTTATMASEGLNDLIDLIYQDLY